MINNVLNNELINTDADIKGIGLQKIRAVERLLTGLLENKTAIMCAIEYIDDVLQIDLSTAKPEYITEQNKSYASSFSLNSKEVKNSLRIFFDNWYGTVEGSESIKFVFYTNTSIMKENKVGVLKTIALDLPDEPILQLLIDKKFTSALPFIKAVFADYYIEQYKKHVKDVSAYEKILKSMKDEQWISFLQLIEWNFGKADEVDVRKKVIADVERLCDIYNVDKKHINSIVAELLDMVESRTFENDFLKKVVHIGEVKSLFLEKAIAAKVKDSLDPMYTKWDEIQCDDIRNLKEKVTSVCPAFDQDDLDYFYEEYTDGAYEQKKHNDIRAVKAYNYRILSACRREIKKTIKDKKGIFTQSQINDLINDLTDKSEILINDKARTYEIAFRDRDMIWKTILILFEECYLAFDERSVENG